MTRYLGVDLHKNSFTVCFYQVQPEKTDFKTYPLNKLDEFKAVLKKSDFLAVESTTNTRYFVEQLSKRVHEVKVINPSQFKVISQSVKKTDKNDAQTIAIYLSKGLLPEVRMKDKKYTELQSLAHTRSQLVKLRTSLKNKIHNILTGYGINIKRESLSSEKGLQRVLNYKVSPTAQIELKIIVSQIKSLNQNIKELDQELIDRGKKIEGHESLTSIKGIGDKSASIFLSIIGDVNDFESAKKLSAYFGIVPRVSNSNQTIKHGRITKQGNKLGRTTLIQCTLVAIRYSDYLRSFYQKLKTKKGAGKAIIATAKKYLTIIYNTLKNKWVFKDFTKFELQAN